MGVSISMRRSGRVLLAAVILAVGLLGGLGVRRAEAALPPVSPAFLCASMQTKHFFYMPAGCLAGYQRVDLSVSPVTVCVNASTQQIISSTGGPCPPGHRAAQIGNGTNARACAQASTRKVGWRQEPNLTCNGQLLYWGTPPNSTITGTFACDGCPIAILDLTTINSTATVSGLPARITDVNVILDITHTFPGDLDVTLTSPGGTAIELFTDVCASNDNILATLDDSAATSIGTICPVNGTFLREGGQVTEPFAGENPNGVWTLTVFDDAGADTGTLNGWSLEITSTAAAPPPTTTTNVACDACPTGLPDVTTVNSTATAAGIFGTIVDVNVNLDITHTFPGDLDVTLTSPGGTVIELFTDVCGTNDNMLVTLDDAAPTPIGTTCPANGTFTPEASAMSSAFAGENPNGVWTLTIVDDAGGDTGTLNGWSLEITT
jgi:subtilisin-like proprotein convertase family protein